MPAGELRERLEFQQRAIQSDGYGGKIADFVAEFTVAARVQSAPGRETVQAARLAGQQPVTITVRKDSRTSLIQADWRARNVRTQVLYAITAPPADPDEGRMYLAIPAVIGQAA